MDKAYARVAVAVMVCALAGCDRKAVAPAPFNVANATIQEIQTALQDGRVTSRELTTQYLARIGLYDQRLHGVDGGES